MPLIPFTATIIYICALFLIPPANAQMGIPPGVACRPDRQGAVDKLEKDYNEKQIGVGQINDTTIMEFFASPEGSFTILSTELSGRTCIITVGQNLDLQALEDKGI